MTIFQLSTSPPGIHGDEVVGRELVLYLARALCQQFNSDSSITELLSTTEIHLMPSLNTDGYILKTRNNANDKVIDLLHSLLSSIHCIGDILGPKPEFPRLGPAWPECRGQAGGQGAGDSCGDDLAQVSVTRHVTIRDIMTIVHTAVITTSWCLPVSMTAGPWSSSPGMTLPPVPPPPTR